MKEATLRFAARDRSIRHLLSVRTAVDSGGPRLTERGIKENVKKIISAGIPGRTVRPEVGYKDVQPMDEH